MVMNNIKGEAKWSQVFLCVWTEQDIYELITFEHLIDVILVILYPPVVTQFCAHHFLWNPILSDVDHGVPIVSL